jgi:hypothetical protein
VHPTCRFHYLDINYNKIPLKSRVVKLLFTFNVSNMYRAPSDPIPLSKCEYKGIIRSIFRVERDLLPTMETKRLCTPLSPISPSKLNGYFVYIQYPTFLNICSIVGPEPSILLHSIPTCYAQHSKFSMID